jgi:hypothetical protein
MTQPFKECRSGAPVQREADNGKSQRVIGRVAQEIERVGAQAHGAGDHTRDDFDHEHRRIEAECDPQNLAVAAAGFGGMAIVIAAAHGDDLASLDALNMGARSGVDMTRNDGFSWFSGSISALRQVYTNYILYIGYTPGMARREGALITLLRRCT